jgi:hypothetical protein
MSGAPKRMMDTADQTSLTRAASPVARLELTQAKPLKLVPAKPEMNRQERAILTAYLVMTALIVAFLAVTGLVASLWA